MSENMTMMWTPEQVQEEALKSRSVLFEDPIVGFDYAAAGVRTNATAENEEKRVNAITNNVVRFTFISHRQLIMCIGDNEIILQATNMFGNYKNENKIDCAQNNPYLKIAKVIRNNINHLNNSKMKKKEIVRIANAIQGNAEELIEAVKSHQIVKEKAFEKFEEYVKQISHNKINLRLWDAKKRISIDFKPWGLFNERCKNRDRGKRNVNMVAQTIIKIFEESPGRHNKEKKSDIITGRKESDSKSELDTFMNEHIELLATCLNKQQSRWQTSLVINICNNIIRCEIQNSTITIVMSEIKKHIDTKGKSNEEVKQEIRKCLSQIIVCAAINSNTREELLSVISEDSLLNFISNMQYNEYFNIIQNDVVSRTTKQKRDKHKNVNQSAEESFNKDVADFLNSIYDHIEEYNPPKIKAKITQLFKRTYKQSKKLEYKDFMSKKNKIMLDDYLELCTTLNAA